MKLALLIYLLGVADNYLTYSQFVSSPFHLFMDSVGWPIMAITQIIGFLHHKWMTL